MNTSTENINSPHKHLHQNQVKARTPQVFTNNQDRFGYTVLIVHYEHTNDWHNNITMKDLYRKGFYQ